MESKRDSSSVAPARTLLGADSATTTVPGSQIPPQPTGDVADDRPSFTSRLRRTDPDQEAAVPSTSSTAPGASSGPRQVRQAKLRLVQVEPWSVMKTAFMLSIAIGIVTVVAVAIVWGVLGAAGLWDSVNSIVQDSIGDSKGAPFEIQKYLGTSRVLGFTMIVAVVDVVLITAIATLGAFLYNLAAGLLGGVEVTFAEDN